MFKNIKMYNNNYVCTESCIRIFLHKSNITDHKENI